ncbi:MAG: AN1-type zinc finger protein, partial [Nitrososphaerota archaeon]
MVKCTVCGVDELLPFKCAYCGESFCPEHRIPEKHGCGGIMLAKSPIERGRAEKLGVDWTGPPMARGVFERREIYHLVAATTLITAAGISLFIFSTGSPAALAISVAGLALSFLAHELAHKFYAIRIGLT